MLSIGLPFGGAAAQQRGEGRAHHGLFVHRVGHAQAFDLVDAEGCAADPSWRVTARRVIYDQSASRVRFEGAMLELFGARILPLPGLAIRTDGKAESGFLVPDVRVTQVNGLELSGEYYWRLADNRDLTLGAYVFSNVAPMASAKWRHLTEKGAYQITGFGTFSDRLTDFTGAESFQSDPRGYLDANGRFQFSPDWSLTGSLRLASDRTFLRRYDISRDDRLRSMIEIERIDQDSYLTIAGYATQTLRLGVPQGQVPIALPMIDYRYRLDAPGIGGKLELQANSLALFRPATLTSLYRLQPDNPLFLLMQHRAGLFFAVFVACIFAAFVPEGRRLAVLVVGISMVSFLLLYWQAGSPAPLRKIAQVDLAGLPVLAGVAWLAFRQ